MVCKKMIYSGRVQGVGFRYTAQILAAALPVTGYVKNLPSGQVELVAQAEPEVIDKLLNAIAQRMGNNISRTDITDMDNQDFSGFQIRF